MIWDNWIIWAICLLGFFCYFLVFFELLQQNKSYTRQQKSWAATLAAMISALPLLGLLGTIIGLLETFHAMSLGHTLEQPDLLSSGISDALQTTQFGLAFAVPAWLLLYFLNHRRRHRLLEGHNHET